MEEKPGCREFVRQEFTWTANFLRTKFKMNPMKIKGYMREILEVSV